jgi:hypothetical protein
MWLCAGSIVNGSTAPRAAGDGPANTKAITAENQILMMRAPRLQNRWIKDSRLTAARTKRQADHRKAGIR